MSKNKLLLILALLVLFMIACAVSAANDHIAVSDTNDDGNNTLKDSNDIMSKESTLNTNLENKNVKNNRDAVSNDGESNSVDTSYTQLAKDIKENVKDGVLNLTHDYTYDPTKDASYKKGIHINRNFIINGNNHIINGLDTARVFYIDSGKLTINNLRISNCSSNDDGGAIYCDEGSVTIDNSSFIGNFAKDYGGAVWSNDNVTVSDCVFENNTADDEGGAIYADDESVSISNSTFIHNHAKTEGGAVWSNKGVKVSNSLFRGNVCTGARTMQCEGGAIYSDEGNVTIDNSSFMGNEADDYGGAIWSNDNVTVSNCYFQANYAFDDEGGAIYCDDESVTISNSTFFLNWAKTEGGVVWSSKGVNVSNSLFNYSDCSYDRTIQCKGGAIYSNADGVIIENSSFINNCADDYGGAVWSSDNITVKNSLFSGNHVYKDGGALYADDESVILINSTFIGNWAGEDGGVFYDNGKGDNAYVCGCNIHDNSARKRGGAIYMDSYTSYITLTGNAMYNNDAEYGEGLDVYTYGYFGTIYGNWWSTDNPDWGKHLLYEHVTFRPNVDHEDSDPLNYNPFNNNI